MSETRKRPGRAATGKAERATRTAKTETAASEVSDVRVKDEKVTYRYVGGQGRITVLSDGQSYDIRIGDTFRHVPTEHLDASPDFERVTVRGDR